MIIFGKGTDLSLDNVFYIESYELIDDDGKVIDTYTTPIEALNDMIAQYGKYHKIHSFKRTSIYEYEFYIDESILTIKNRL